MILVAKQQYQRTLTLNQNNNHINSFKMRTLKYTITILLLTISITASFAQTANTEGVSISKNVVPPDESAMLDVSSGSKGLLIPRVALLSTTNSTLPIPSPANSLLVYNNATVSDVTPGYYYWSSSLTKWLKLTAGSFGAPQVTYDQMLGMRSGMTLADRGAMVYVTTVSSSHGVHSCTDCLETHYVLGLWYLSSYTCTTSAQALEWHRVQFDRGTNTSGNACPVPDDCCDPAVSQ